MTVVSEVISKNLYCTTIVQCNVQVNLSLSLIRNHAMEMGMEAWLHIFLTLAPDGSE
jgi:hypothetical protein